MGKGLDRNFLHYGIRTEDLELIQTLCEKHDLDADWVKEEILKAYPEKKVDAIEMGDFDTWDRGLSLVPWDRGLSPVPLDAWDRGLSPVPLDEVI